MRLLKRWPRLLLKRWPRLLLATLLATVGLVAVSQPASASVPVCPEPWANEQAMANEPSAECRSSWLDDPGIGHFLTREQLLTGAQLYARHNFTRQWLWYAPATTITVADPSAQDWTACPLDQHFGVGPCPATATLPPPHSLFFDFGSDPVPLSVFTYDHRVIVRLCGNYFTPQSDDFSSVPVPSFTVQKFNDRNGNGVRDGGEELLPGWTFQIVRTASTFHDQPTGFVTTITTGPDGTARFQLDGQGPGTYAVQEVGRDDWTPTTAPVQTVVVPDGVGDATIENLSFGNIFQAISASGTAITPTEGGAFTGTVATFTDPDAGATVGEYTASVDWGDGTPASKGTLTKTADGAFAVIGTHTYAEEGTATVAVAISDIDNPANDATATTAARIGDAGLTPGTAATPDAVEGIGFTAAVGTFTDANPGGTIADFTATVNWGDGNTSPGTVSGPTGGPFTVTAAHTYREEGNYPLTVDVVDDGGAATTLTGAATVADAPIAAAGNPNLLSTNPLTNIAVATFTDANPGGPVGDFTATIDWGDGTPTTAGTVTGATGGPFTVTGTHTYATLGPKTITVHILDEGGSTAVAVSHVIVFAYPSGGNFVIGDTTTANGAHINFWGSQWANNNPLSGGAPPDAFKGFEDNPAIPTCGAPWTSLPGNSSNPPGTAPTYMAVIVSTHVAQSGSNITGDVQHIVIVQTNPGYAGSPGHEGTGTIVATLC